MKLYNFFNYNNIKFSIFKTSLILVKWKPITMLCKPRLLTDLFIFILLIILDF